MLTEFPDFKDRKVLILNGAWYGDTVALFAEANFKRANTFDEADLVVFLGGEDVSPSLYDQDPIAKCGSSNMERDMVEKWYFEKCVKEKKPMFGICRGAQFLHVMNGGKLWQDVNNHAGHSHDVLDIEENLYFRSNSYHHQMIQNNDSLTVVAVTKDRIATTFEDQDLKIDLSSAGTNSNSEIEIEAGFYEETRCFFTQGHPEVGTPKYRAWTMCKLHDFLLDWEAVKDDPEFEMMDVALETAKMLN
jgi:hypothetical protein